MEATAIKDHDKRFIIEEKQSVAFGREVVVLCDRETGVQYISFQSGYGGDLTVLVDREGRPLIAPVY